MKRITATVHDKHLAKFFELFATLGVFEFTITDADPAAPKARRVLRRARLSPTATRSPEQDVLNSRPCALIMTHYGTGLTFTSRTAESWVKAAGWAGASPHLSRLKTAGYIAREGGLGNFKFLRPFPAEVIKRLTSKEG